MPPVGRPPAARGVYSFEALVVPPREVVLDASFVVDALITSQSRHDDCQAFLTDMATPERPCFSTGS